MAELYAGARAEQPAASVSLGRLTNWLGALVSVALIVGVSVWGYKLLVRDVSGVPVVRAAEGPLRVQPDDPGGRPADHQGLAVNNVAAVGTAAPPAERLVLAPRPVSLTEDDAPRAVLTAARALASDTVPDMADAAQRNGANTAQDDAPAQPGDDATVDDLVAKLTANSEPLSAGDDSDTMSADAPGENAETAPARPESGLARSLRPQLRPTGIETQVASADSSAAVVAAVAANSGARDVDPADIPVGTRLAQLGAYDSAEVARKEWRRLEQRFGEYMDGKDRVIQRAQSGGRTFYRLRAMGFEDLPDARRFCAAFVSEKADCIPVVTR
ncbi:SPOR domain-containing protein [Lutimaribacter sp. EGI FJ00015]|uniref:SPOR domain-containing protein n=1 Tax=Lutimaribacter degradans TaxID=2945989 RepID=A0ACC5ZVR0_9RHOB|nr:SPOR domain-containing protein [Lutimaribacter sp. EGI FJ00013]MCM2562417.1 SPOR domain-containing protein [Lutimaribacter sp. EGI FJ00013]MCO0613574.1 SPOR domain-containing protein [Lutimaribacter sp. EGI FJ00015]MCO0636546.1 SPOR domain-containing protein [Lutimaribacter sp. EGI FJ00014]